MALVTVNAVVHVPVYVRVLEVIGVVIPMAARALEDRVITTVNVTGGALAVCVAVVDRESRVLRVIECRPRPCTGRVAGRALRGREEQRVLPGGMRRVGGAVVIALVARNACIAGQVVIVVHVAVRAYPRRHSVHSCQCEARVVVVKRGVGPVDRVVTSFTRRGEARGGVRRVSRSGVVLLVA